MTRTLVFTRTKRGADRVARHLETSSIKAAAIHGNKSQRQRENALEDFRKGRINVLVATDIAARGIDIDLVTHVVNFELPEVPEAYVHRIGRTARAGASGSAISFCDAEERDLLRAIERTTRQQIPHEDRRNDANLVATVRSSSENDRPRSGNGQDRGARQERSGSRDNQHRGGASQRGRDRSGDRTHHRDDKAPRTDRVAASAPRNDRPQQSRPQQSQSRDRDQSGGNSLAGVGFLKRPGTASPHGGDARKDGQSRGFRGPRPQGTRGGERSFRPRQGGAGQ